MQLEEAQKIAVFYQQNVGKYPENIMALVQQQAANFQEFVLNLERKFKEKGEDRYDNRASTRRRA